MACTAAARDKAELAVSLILNSSLQVALALTPALVLLSMFMGGEPLTLVVTPLLAGAVAFSALLTFAIVVDGESNWLEGARAHRPVRDHRGVRLVGTRDRRLTWPDRG